MTVDKITKYWTEASLLIKSSSCDKYDFGHFVVLLMLDFDVQQTHLDILMDKLWPHSYKIIYKDTQILQHDVN